MALVKFYRGAKSKYDIENHIDGIFFSLDTKEIIVNGDSFGYFAGAHKEIASVEYTAPDTIKISYTNGTDETITIQTAVAGATADESKAGLISKEDVFKLAEIEANADVNIIETVKVNNVALTPDADKAVNVDLTGIQQEIAESKVTNGNTSVTVVAGKTVGGTTTPTTVAVKLKDNGGINLGTDGLELDASATEVYTGDSKAITVDESADTNNKKKVALKLNTKTGNILTATSDGLFASVKLKTLDVPVADANVATRYGLVGLDAAGNEISVGDVTIDILKDKFLKSVALDIIPAGKPEAGDDALVFTFVLADGTEKIEYVNVSSFLREAEAGNGIEFKTATGETVKKYHLKLNTSAIEKNSSNTAYLQLDTDGLKLVGINAELAKAKTEVEAKATGHVTVTVTSQTDGHNKVTVSENDIASAQDLASEIERAGKAEAKAKTEVVAKSTGFVTVTVEDQTDGHAKVTISENNIASASDLSEVSGRVAALESGNASEDDWEVNDED